MYIPKQRKNTTSITADILTKFCSTIKTDKINDKNKNATNYPHIHISTDFFIKYCTTKHIYFTCTYLIDLK